MELKTFICIKEVDKKHQLKQDYVVVDKEKNSLKIQDPYNGNAGFQRIPIQKQDVEFTFKCDQILENTTSSNVFQKICNEITTNVINQTKNGIVIQHGQSRTGKSTVLFGNKNEEGILQLTINKFFKSNQSQLYLYMFDINLETVRDFGLYFFNTTTNSWRNEDFDFSYVQRNSLEKQSCELLDNSNEIIQVRGLSKIEIKSSDQFNKLLEDEEIFRKNLDEKHKISNKRYNQVYILQLNNKTTKQTSYMYFVKLAGSEKIMKESYQQEQVRIQEQIMANNQLFSLSKYIGGLSKKSSGLSYHESKLTKSLHGILQNDEKPTQVSFISHIYPVEQNYEESLLSLQYLDRLKAYDSTYKKVIFDGPMPEQVQAQERLMQRLLDENSEIKKRYEALQQEEKDKFEEIKKKLGLEYSVNSILKAKSNTKEYSYIKLHQEADERNLNQKFKAHLLRQEQSGMQIQNLRKKCDQQIELLESKYDELQGKYSDVKSKIKIKVNQEQKEISDELNKMLTHGHLLIEDKANLIHGIKNEIKKTSEHSNKMLEMKEIGKKEAEFQYKLQYNQKYQQFKNDLKNIKEQYEHLIEDKDQQINQFQNESSQYSSQKKELLRNARKEIVQLFQIVRTQYQTIQWIEEGMFSGGIKSYNIPKSDKCQYPDRDSYQLQIITILILTSVYSLYKSLEKTGTLISTQTNKQNLQYTKQQQLNEFLKDENLEDSYIFDLQKKQENKTTECQQHIKPSYCQYEEESSSRTITDFEPYRKLKEEEISIMSLDQLKTLAKAFQQEIKKCQNTQPLNPVGIKGQTLANLIKEKDKYKQLLVTEQKRYNDSLEVLESQKRIIEKFSKLTHPRAQNANIMTKTKKENNQTSSISSSIPTLKGSRTGTQMPQRKF